MQKESEQNRKIIIKYQIEQKEKKIPNRIYDAFAKTKISVDTKKKPTGRKRKEKIHDNTLTYTGKKPSKKNQAVYIYTLQIDI